MRKNSKIEGIESDRKRFFRERKKGKNYFE